MTTYYSDLALSKDYGDHNSPKGVVLASKATYTVPAGGIAQNDLVQLNPIPKNAVVIDVMLMADGGTASLTIDVGDGTTVDLFIDGQDGSAAFMCRSADAASVGNKFTSAGHLYMKALGAGMTAEDVYTCVVTYFIDE